MEEQKKTSEFAIASLVLGIFQFVHIFNTEKAILAIIFGVLALKRIAESGNVGKGKAVAGIILGVIGIITTVAMTIIFWPQMIQMQQKMIQK